MRRGVEAFGRQAATGGAEARGQLCIGQQPGNRAGQRLAVARGGEDSGDLVLDHLRHTAVGEGHHGNARQLGFGQHAAEGFGVGGMHQDREMGPDLSQVAAVAEEGQAVAEAQGVGLAAQRLAVGQVFAVLAQIPPADDQEAGVRRRYLGGHLHEAVMPLPGPEASDGSHELTVWQA